jgi:DNA polymerase III subunit delta
VTKVRRRSSSTARDPADDTLLLISLPKLDGSAQKTKWGKALVEGAHTQFVQIWPVDANQLPQWIRQRLVAGRAGEPPMTPWS